MNYFWHGADVEVEPVGETALVCISNERAGVNVTGQLTHDQLAAFAMDCFAALVAMETVLSLVA